MIQWIDDVLSKGTKVDFFYDEYRCPVFVKDVVAVIISLTMKWVTGEEVVFRHYASFLTRTKTFFYYYEFHHLIPVVHC